MTSNNPYYHIPTQQPDEPVTFGAVIETPRSKTLKAPPALRSPPSHDSDLSSVMAPTTPVVEKELGFDSSNPFSAFYNHPEARRSMDEKLAPALPAAQNSKTHLDVTGYETDLESGRSGSNISAVPTLQNPKVSVDGRVKECTMWPSRQDQLERKKRVKRARGCRLWRNLGNKQRLWIKIIIALVIVAAAVGLGIGISKAVGGGVWSGQGRSKEIGG